MKFRSIIAQTGTYTCSAAQVILKYLKPLYSWNNYIIRNTNARVSHVFKITRPIITWRKIRIIWCRNFIHGCTSTWNYWLYSTRNLCERKITKNIFQINHEAFITKISNRKDLHVELNLLQINWQRHNGWTPIYQIFQHPYDQNRRRSF